MIIKEDFLKKLRSAFSLNIYEVKIWTALLSKGVASAGELSEIGDVPRSRTYDVLESLEKRGFIIMKLGKPIKYIAVKPEEVFKRVKRGIQQKTMDQIETLNKVEKTDLFKDLRLLFSQGIENIDPASISGAIKGRKNLYNHLAGMLDGAKSSVTFVTSAEGLIRKADILKRVFKKLNDKNVKVRVMAPINTENKAIADHLSKFAKVKNADKFKSRFCIVDSKEVLFMVGDDKLVHENYDNGIWVSSPYFASALENLFTSYWNK
jgi:sugar-specific transcriptional regulator TrmB